MNVYTIVDNETSTLACTIFRIWSDFIYRAASYALLQSQKFNSQALENYCLSNLTKLTGWAY